jgi:hypothetical protein
VHIGSVERSETRELVAIHEERHAAKDAA